MAQTKKKLAAAVKASGSTLTEVFGVGPVIAAITLAEVQDVSRFPGRDHFAAYDGTAPIEVSSGKRKVHRLSRRGNRGSTTRVHMAAITQIRHRHGDGRAYYDKKLAEGKTPKEALRALKRRISDALYRHLRADARRAAATAAAQLAGPGGQPGTTLSPARPDCTPRRPALRQSHSRARAHTTTPALPLSQKAQLTSLRKDVPNPLTQRGFDMYRERS